MLHLLVDSAVAFGSGGRVEHLDETDAVIPVDGFRHKRL